MSAPAQPATGPERSLPASLAANPNLAHWIEFAADGTVTVRSGKVEYGQGVWTALAQVAAEELDVALGRVRVAPVSTSSSPDEGVTSGSRSIEESGGALRQASAQARAVFLASGGARRPPPPPPGRARPALRVAERPRPARPPGRGRCSRQGTRPVVRRRAQRPAAGPPGQGHWTAALPARPGAAGHGVRPGGPATGPRRHARPRGRRRPASRCADPGA